MGVKTLSYLLEDALSSIRSAKFVNFISITTITISMLVFAVFLWGVFNLDALAAGWSKDAQLTIYLRNSSTEEERLTLLTTLQKKKEVLSVDYISKDQALAEFKKGLKGQEAILEGISGNPLPSSFEVRFRDESRTAVHIDMLAEEMRKMAGVEDVQYGKEWLENLSRFLATLKYLGVLVGIGLALSVTFIVANTVRLTVYTRAEEVEIMKLIGATDSFIKWPFIIEGALQGTVGAAMALLAAFGFHRAASIFIASSTSPLLQGVSLHFLSTVYCIAFVAAGMLLGLAGGYLSVRAFFKAA